MRSWGTLAVSTLSGARSVVCARECYISREMTARRLFLRDPIEPIGFGGRWTGARAESLRFGAERRGARSSAKRPDKGVFTYYVRKLRYTMYVHKGRDTFRTASADENAKARANVPPTTRHATMAIHTAGKDVGHSEDSPYSRRNPRKTPGFRQ